MNIFEAPQWIRENYSSDGNMGEWANNLDNVVEYIDPYLEENFCDNHFKGDLGEDVKWKKLSEGMWHLHVLWSLGAKGLKLVKPYTKDDILVINQKTEIGIEITFSGWGNPNGRLALTHRSMREVSVEVDNINGDIVSQAMDVLSSKNNKLIKRLPKIPRIVALNEVALTNGYHKWSRMDTVHRRRALTNMAKLKKYDGIDGFTYDYISYSDYFRRSDLTLSVLRESEPLTLATNFLAAFLQA